MLQNTNHVTLYVRKPTALIHFERELSVVAQKVMTLIVAHCQKATKNSQGFYFIDKRQVCDAMGWDQSHDTSRVVQAFWEIFNNSIAWNVFEQDRGFKRLNCKLIIALLTPTEDGRYVGFRLYPELEQVIQSPKVFGRILLKTPALLTRSEYAFPLYELLADHVSREDGTLRISLIDLKRYLGIRKHYSVFPVFKVRVLTPSIDSINTLTDIQVSYETWKIGRAVGGLLFSINRNERVFSLPIALGSPQTVLEVALTEPPLSVTEPPPPVAPSAPPPAAVSTEEQAFLERLTRHQISAEDAALALQTHGLEKAREIFGYVRQEVLRRKGTPDEIRNGSAYLARCLREGYGVKSDAERDAQQAQDAAQAARLAHAQAAAEVAAQSRSAAQQRSATVQARLAALPVAEQMALEKAFLAAEPVWVRRPAHSLTRTKAFESWLMKQWL